MKQPRSSGTIFWVLFTVLAAIEIAPFWLLDHFPSQDGPSHLYNTVVVDQYRSQPLYRDFYELHLRPSGNLVSQGLAMFLMRFTGPEEAQRVLLTVYALLLPLSVYYVLCAVGGSAHLSLIGFLFVPNFFLHMGFWNFCYSIPIALLAFGYFLRKDGDGWKVGPTVLCSVLSLLVYLTHIVGWGVLAGAIVCTRLTKEAGRGRWRPLLALLPAAALAGVFVATGSEPDVLPAETLRERLWPLYGVSFLRTVADSDGLFGRMTVVFLLGLAAAAAWSRRTALRAAPFDEWLLLAGLLVAGSVAVPDVIGEGAYLRARLLLFAFLFLAMWCAVQKIPKGIAWGTGGAVLVLCGASMLLRMPVYWQWDGVLREFARAGEAVAPGSTLLALRSNDDGMTRIRPLLHAAGLFSPKPFIDLGNYEAGTGHFLTAFRAEVSPYPPLADKRKLEIPPIPFNIERYERTTGKRVDYLLFYASPRITAAGVDPEPGKEYPEEQVYAAQLEGFELVHKSEGWLRLRLWRRSETAGVPR